MLTNLTKGMQPGSPMGGTFNEDISANNSTRAEQIALLIENKVESPVLHYEEEFEEEMSMTEAPANIFTRFARGIQRFFHILSTHCKRDTTDRGA